MRFLVTTLLILFTPLSLVWAAPYAAILIDAETNEVIYEENSTTRLHPAGLTKLMTLYAAFDAIETGLIDLDEQVRISLKSYGEPPVKLGLREGQRIKLRYLLRASGVKGANDASTAIAEGIDGTEEAFARRMNGISSELGLSRSSWVNAHGLTEKGHLSTAHDMAILFAAHKRDFPAYFNLFRRVRTHAGLREVENSAARLLTEIDGIRGAKYGYSRAAGFNGAVYVQVRDKKFVAVIFGAKGRASLTNKMQALLEKGQLR